MSKLKRWRKAIGLLLTRQDDKLINERLDKEGLPDLPFLKKAYPDAEPATVAFRVALQAIKRHCEDAFALCNFTLEHAHAGCKWHDVSASDGLLILESITAEKDPDKQRQLLCRIIDILPSPTPDWVTLIDAWPQDLQRHALDVARVHHFLLPKIAAAYIPSIGSAGQALAAALERHPMDWRTAGIILAAFSDDRDVQTRFNTWKQNTTDIGSANRPLDQARVLLASDSLRGCSTSLTTVAKKLIDPAEFRRILTREFREAVLRNRRESPVRHCLDRASKNDAFAAMYIAQCLGQLCGEATCDSILESAGYRQRREELSNEHNDLLEMWNEIPDSVDSAPFSPLPEHGWSQSEAGAPHGQSRKKKRELKEEINSILEEIEDLPGESPGVLFVAVAEDRRSPISIRQAAIAGLLSWRRVLDTSIHKHALREIEESIWRILGVSPLTIRNKTTEDGASQDITTEDVGARDEATKDDTSDETGQEDSSRTKARPWDTDPLFEFELSMPDDCFPIELADYVARGVLWAIELNEIAERAGEPIAQDRDAKSMNDEPEVERNGTTTDQLPQSLSFHEIRNNVISAFRLVPKGQDFIRKFPLVLLSPHRAMQVLGYYLTIGQELVQITEYDPPKYGKGTVKKRYNVLLDRNSPNSMGIAYPLLAHPVFAASVIYHELLHWGGSSWIEGEGIACEGEVWLRQALATRDFIARSAPASLVDIRGYEEALLESALHGAWGTLKAEGAIQILVDAVLCNFQDDRDFLQFVLKVVGAYWDQRDPPENVVKKLAGQIDDCNLRLSPKAKDIALRWDPEKKYPHLSTEDKDAIRKVAENRWQVRHHINLEMRDRILAENAVQLQVEAWKKYRDRGGGDELTRMLRTLLQRRPRASIPRNASRGNSPGVGH